MSIIINAGNVYGCFQNFIDDKDYTGYKITIPWYQREFAWHNKQTKALWDDLSTILNSKSPFHSHFFGNIFLLQNTVNKEFEIVDGQQRITSIILILYAIRACANRTEEIWKALPGAKAKIETTLGKIEKILERFRTNTLNDRFFKAYISSRKSILLKESKEICEDFKRYENYSINESLRKAFDYFLNNINDIIDKDIEGKEKESASMDVANNLQRLYTLVMEELEIVILISSETKMATRIFETLNDRGKTLDEIDLIKNKIWEEQFNPESIQLWNDMRREFRDPLQFQRFINYFFAIRKGKKISTKSLYSTINHEFINGRLTGEKLIKDLNKIYKQYLFFTQKDKQDKNVFQKDALRHLGEEYCACNYAFPSYVMIACFNRYNKGEYADKDLYRIFSLCYNIMYRYKSILRGTASDLETLMLDVAKAINGDEKGNSGIGSNQAIITLSNWAKKNAKDEDFVKALNDYVDTSNQFAVTYTLLRRIDSYPDTPTGFFTWTCYDRTQVQLEHILPQKYEKEKGWNYFVKAENYVKRVGNMCLFKGNDNSKIKNKPYMDKKIAYQKSTTRTGEQTIATAFSVSVQFSEWTDKEVDTRQLQLAKEAARVFPIEPDKLFEAK